MGCGARFFGRCRVKYAALESSATGIALLFRVACPSAITGFAYGLKKTARPGFTLWRAVFWALQGLNSYLEANVQAGQLGVVAGFLIVEHIGKAVFAKDGEAIVAGAKAEAIVQVVYVVKIF